MVLIDIVDDLSIEKIFIYWSKIWEIQLQHYAKYEIEETVSSSTSSTFILVLFTMIFFLIKFYFLLHLSLCFFLIKSQ